MNKAELIDAVAEGADISKAAATRAVDTFVDSVTNTLKNGDQVTLVGFGTFSVRPRAAPSAPSEHAGRLAQLGEHRPYKARVAGSIPAAPTTFCFLISGGVGFEAIYLVDLVKFGDTVPE